MFRMFSYVGCSVGPTTSSTSVLRRSNTSGWSERRNTTNVSVDAVCKGRLVPRPTMGCTRRTVSRPAIRIFKVSSRKIALSATSQLDGPRYKLNVTRPVVFCKRESSSVLLSLSASPGSVREACLAKPLSSTGFRNSLMTFVYGSDLSVKNSCKTQISPLFNLSFTTVSAPMSACEKASCRVISLADL